MELIKLGTIIFSILLIQDTVVLRIFKKLNKLLNKILNKSLNKELNIARIINYIFYIS